MRCRAPRVALAVPAVLALAGCGSTPDERAAAGAGIGAGAGAAGGAVTGLTVVEGALLGMAGGVFLGALTDPKTLNLGEPLWKRPPLGPVTTNFYFPNSAHAARVRRVQRALRAFGLYHGPANGHLGAETRSAIRSYQAAHGLAVDGEPSPALIEHMQARVPAPAADGPS